MSATQALNREAVCSLLTKLGAENPNQLSAERAVKKLTHRLGSRAITDNLTAEEAAVVAALGFEVKTDASASATEAPAAAPAAKGKGKGKASTSAAAPAATPAPAAKGKTKPEAPAAKGARGGKLVAGMKALIAFTKSKKSYTYDDLQKCLTDAGLSVATAEWIIARTHQKNKAFPVRLARQVLYTRVDDCAAAGFIEDTRDWENTPTAQW